MTYAHLLRKSTDLRLAWSSTSPIGIEKNIFPNDKIAPMTDTRNILSTIVLM